MSTTTSKHRQLTELIVENGDRRNRNNLIISDLIKIASVLTTHPATGAGVGAPLVLSVDLRFEQPFPPIDGVESVRKQFEEIAHAFRRAHAALTIDTTDRRAFDFRWHLGDQVRIDWTVPRDMLGPEPFLCTTCDGQQRVGQRGESEHCPDCDHGYFELIDLGVQP